MSRVGTLAVVFGILVLLVPFVPSSGAAGITQQLQMTVDATSPVYAGQTVQIVALVQLDNGTSVGSKATFSITKLFYPNGTAINLSGGTVLVNGLVRWTYVLPAKAPDGLYGIAIFASLTGTNGTWALGSFTVNSQVASALGLTALAAQLTAVSTQLSTLSTTLTTKLSGLSSDLGGNFTAVLTEMSTNFATLSSVTNAISTNQAKFLSALKANTTAVLGAMTNDYNALSTALSSGLGGVRTSLGGLASDVKGNFTALTGTINTLKGALASLASSASLSALNSTMTSGFGTLNAALGNLASSTQANGLKSSIESLANQVGLVSNIEDFVLLPVAILALVLLAVIFLRKKQA